MGLKIGIENGKLRLSGQAKQIAIVKDELMQHKQELIQYFEWVKSFSIYDFDKQLEIAVSFYINSEALRKVGKLAEGLEIFFRLGELQNITGLEAEEALGYGELQHFLEMSLPNSNKRY